MAQSKDQPLNTLRNIEAFADIPLDEVLIDELLTDDQQVLRPSAITFYLPGFKSFCHAELQGCASHHWPAVSITGPQCVLQCDHCRAGILKPMIAAETPAKLSQVMAMLVNKGAAGMLLTGGSNLHNEIAYGPYFSTLEEFKTRHPNFKIAMHTALVDAAQARHIAASGIDVAMLDIIGAQDTVTQVYHLKRTVADFEASLVHLLAAGLRVVPHIVVGLHYGRLLGEWQALSMVQKHRPHGLVLVVVMPQYAAVRRPFVTPNPHEVGRFFREARRALPHIPLYLGCARPAGTVKAILDCYAVLAGIDAIAYPTEGCVALAKQYYSQINVQHSCCAMGWEHSLSTRI